MGHRDGGDGEDARTVGTVGTRGRSDVRTFGRCGRSDGKDAGTVRTQGRWDGVDARTVGTVGTVWTIGWWGRWDSEDDPTPWTLRRRRRCDGRKRKEQRDSADKETLGRKDGWDSAMVRTVRIERDGWDVLHLGLLDGATPGQDGPTPRTVRRP